MGVSSAETSRWEHLLGLLPDYGMTPEGNIREWNYDGLEERYQHRHLSHIYPVFPGNEFVAGRDTERLAAFALAVDKRVLGSQSGWSLAHMACINARLERPENAVECLDILARACLLNSLFTLHNDWRNMGLSLGRGAFAPIQMDANMGIVNALQEMLFFCADGYIRYLPALPERFEKGKVKGFHFPGGTTDFLWDATTQQLSIHISCKRDATIKVALPWGKNYRMKQDGCEDAMVSGVIVCELRTGKTIEIDTEAEN